MAKDPPIDPGNVAQLEFAPAGLDKTAAEPEIVRWVARNIDNPEPDPADCPDPFAWTLLRQCRADSSFTVFFIQTLWSKLIPSRSQLDTGRDQGELDGKPTIELIERIQLISLQAKGEPSAAGPKEIPNAFEAFNPEEE